MASHIPNVDFFDKKLADATREALACEYKMDASTARRLTEIIEKIPPNYFPIEVRYYSKLKEFEIDTAKEAFDRHTPPNKDNVINCKPGLYDSVRDFPFGMDERVFCMEFESREEAKYVLREPFNGDQANRPSTTGPKPKNPEHGNK